LRHLLCVHVFLDRRVRRRAERVEDQQNFVALDQLARLFDRLRRAVTVVVTDEVDLAPVDTAFGIDLVEVGGFGSGDHAVSGGGTAIGIDVADLDLGIGGADVVFFLREAGAAGDSEDREGSRKGPQPHLDSRHSDLPWIWSGCVDFFDWERLAAPCDIEYPHAESGNRKPPATGSQGASFSLMILGRVY